MAIHNSPRAMRHSRSTAVALTVESLEDRVVPVVTVATGSLADIASQVLQGDLTGVTSTSTATSLPPVSGIPTRINTPASLPPISGIPTPLSTPPVVPANVVATAGGSPTEVKVTYSNGTSYTWYPFGRSYTAGATVALGDLSGDGIFDIVVASGDSGTPGTVQVYSGKTRQLIASYTPFGGFGGGLEVTTGDVTDDGAANIIIGVMSGGWPLVAVLNGQTGAVLDEFLAYSTSFLGGVRVAAGDLNGDGYSDIIVGPGNGQHGLSVKVYNGQSVMTGAVSPQLISQFNPFPASYTGAISVAAGDSTSFFDDVVVGTQTSGDTFAVYSDQALTAGSTTPEVVQSAWGKADNSGIKVAVSIYVPAGPRYLVITNGTGTKTAWFTPSLDDTSPGTWPEYVRYYFTPLAGVTAPINIG